MGIAHKIGLSAKKLAFPLKLHLKNWEAFLPLLLAPLGHVAERKGSWADGYASLSSLSLLGGRTGG